MKLVSEMTISELEHALWICSLGSVPIGGWPKEAYQKELETRKQTGR